MNLPAFSIRRPVTTLMAVALIVSIGLVAMLNSSTDLLPEISMPVVAVATSYSGAGAREVESLLTRPVEQALGYVGGVERITSTSSDGSSVVMAEFGWGTNLDTAVLDIRDAIELVKPYFPDGAGSPRIIKADLSLMPMMRLALSGPYDALELTRIAETMQSRIERIEGIAAAAIGSGVYEEVRVTVIPARMLGYGLTVPTIANVLRAENLSLPGGHIDEAGQRMVLRTHGQFTSVEDVARVAIRTQTGAVIRLADVAQVELVRTTSTSRTRVDGQSAVTLSVRKQSGTNTVEMAAAVRAALAQLQPDLPAGISVQIIQDQSDFINRSLSQVTENILIGGILAVLVLYLFLTEIRTVAVIAMAIPVSILATLAFMFFTGLTLNLVSLGGLALGVGMLVDNAIVILENIYRHRRLGLAPRAAAATGAQEVAMAVTASTITTVVVFLPVVFVQGLASQIFRELAMTVSFALASSLFVAMTFVPMTASLLLRGSGEARLALGARISATSQAIQQSFTARYRAILGWALHRRAVVMGLVVVLAASSAWAALTLPRTLLPAMDQRELSIEVELPTGASPEAIDQVMRQVEAVVAARDDVDFAFSSTAGGAGGMFMGSGYTGQVVVRLLPAQRGLPPTDQVVREIRTALVTIPGAETMVSSRSSVAGEEGAFGAPLAVTLRGDDVDELARLGETVAATMRRLPGVVNIRSSIEQSAPEIQVVVDRERAAGVGLSGAMVGTLIRSAVEGQVATSFRLHEADVDVRVIFPSTARQTVADVGNLLLLTPTGAVVRLADLAGIEVRAGPSSIQRLDGARIATIEAALSGITLEAAMARLRAELAGLDLPPGYTLDFGGETAEIADAFGDLTQALAMAAVLIYMVMAAQFESLRQPLIIMVTLPLALAGAVLGLAVTRDPLSIPSIVGVIALAGIVVNNGIVLVDYTNQLRARGSDVREALLQAGGVRLRPILMTSLTTIIALLPMVISRGAGNELQRSLSVPLLGGLVVSTALTLFVVPVLYSLMAGRAGVPQEGVDS